MGGIQEENKILRKLQNTPSNEVSSQQNPKKMRVSKQQPSTEIYNITIEGGEDRIEYAEGEETKTRIVEDPNSLSISSEIKTGSDSSSELPDDVKELVSNTNLLNVGGKNEIQNEKFDESNPKRDENVAEMTDVQRLKMENQNLLETKNALNIVKDDLLQELDQIANKYAKDKLFTRVNTMEKDLSAMKSGGKGPDEDDGQDEDEEEDPTEKRKRFTRVEMARVLMERNQYKERLMELQEAVRWTEMLRASKYDQIQQSKASESLAPKKPSSVYGFFSRLFGSNAQGGGQPAVQSAGDAAITPEEENKTLSPSNSTELSQLGQVAGFVQDKASYQMSGWMLPSSTEISTSKSSTSGSTVPVPVHCAPLQDKESANAKETFITTTVPNPVPTTTQASNQTSTFNLFSKFM